MQDLGLTSSQHYGIGYGYDQMLQDLWVPVNDLPSQNIEVLGIIIPVLILHNRHHYIILMIHPLPNHLCLPEHSSIQPIIRMNPIFLLIAGMITMMILYLITIQYGNGYIMQVFINVFCEIYYIMHLFWYFNTTMQVFMHSLHV